MKVQALVDTQSENTSLSELEFLFLALTPFYIQKSEFFIPASQCAQVVWVSEFFTQAGSQQWRATGARRAATMAQQPAHPIIFLPSIFSIWQADIND